MNKTIKTICAWCKVLIKDGPTPILLGEPTQSHGICTKCKEDFFNDNNEEEN